MKKILLSILFILLCVTYTYAQQPDTLWSAANELYKEGNFKEAIKKYNDILKSGVESENVYFNLANAYFKSDSLSKSIINYRRALKFAPADEDILHNLEIAKSKTTNKINEVPTLSINKWLDYIAMMFSSNSWAIISIVAFAIMLLFAAAYLLSNTASKRKFSFTISTISLVVFVIALSNSISAKNNIINSDEAVVVSSAISVKSSPDKNGKDLFILNEGVEVNVLEQINGFTEIVIANGSKGWVQSSAIEII